MRRYLIVNGDDFGASSGVNRGILEAHRDGILTSTSLMVDAAASEEAGDLAASAPDLSVGLHLVLDGERRPADGGPAALAREVERQLDRFASLLGRLPTHLDTHHDVHREPAVLEPLLALADDHGLPVRGQRGIRYVPDFYACWNGASHPEQVSLETLLRIVDDEARSGVTELGCHPGYLDVELDSTYGAERELELATLTDPRLPSLLERRAIELVDFSEAARLVRLARS